MQIATQSSIELPRIKKLRSGKVREVFDLGDTLLFVVTDRISAFDVILADPIPHKGAVLNQISAFWFKRFGDVPNHLVTANFEEFPDDLQEFREQLSRRVMVAERIRPSNSRFRVVSFSRTRPIIGKRMCRSPTSTS